MPGGHRLRDEGTIAYDRGDVGMYVRMYVW